MVHFRGFGRGVMVLEYGGFRPDQARPGWERIVHRDVKPHNIFLDRSNDRPDNELYGGRWPSYPKPQLGDFGMAVITSDADPMNPTAYNDQEGTVGWMPQEMFPMLGRDAQYPIVGDKLNQKTNIWGVGAVVLRLMNQEWRTDTEEHASVYNNGKGSGEPCQDRKLKGEATYSRELRDLARSCVRYDPADRPELYSLWQRIGEYAAEEKLGQGMRDAVHEEDNDALRLWYQPDDYKERLASHEI
ncbi:hypothetical protein LTR85_005513 [Meristemomyces frigidus]|nr:hypothetical protein LTR85_005513 [Meristemomyces frigidus]